MAMDVDERCEEESGIIKTILGHFYYEKKLYLNVKWQGYPNLKPEGVLLENILDVNLLKRYSRRERFKKNPSSIPKELQDRLDIEG